MSLAFCKALSALSLWKPSIARGFTSSLVRVTDVSRPAKSVEEHSLADKEKEARERNRAYLRAWRQRLKDDPERWKAYKKRDLAAYNERCKRMKEDPERHKEHSNS
jgi:uncharacterized protein YhaN